MMPCGGLVKAGSTRKPNKSISAHGFRQLFLFCPYALHIGVLGRRKGNCTCLSVCFVTGNRKRIYLHIACKLLAHRLYRPDLMCYKTVPVRNIIGIDSDIIHKYRHIKVPVTHVSVLFVIYPDSLQIGGIVSHINLFADILPVIVSCVVPQLFARYRNIYAIFTHGLISARSHKHQVQL